MLNERTNLVGEFENHIKNCHNMFCRNVEWGMETEYQYIGWKVDKKKDGSAEIR